MNFKVGWLFCFSWFYSNFFKLFSEKFLKKGVHLKRYGFWENPRGVMRKTFTLNLEGLCGLMPCLSLLSKFKSPGTGKPSRNLWWSSFGGWLPGTVFHFPEGPHQWAQRGECMLAPLNIFFYISWGNLWLILRLFCLSSSLDFFRITFFRIFFLRANFFMESWLSPLGFTVAQNPAFSWEILGFYRLLINFLL